MFNKLLSDRIKSTPSSFIREILKVTQNPQIISFAGGLPNPISFPSEALKVSMNNITEKYGNKIYQYSTTTGLDILREYIDSRFSINAMEMTTTEILASLRANKETKLVENNMKTILEVADFVKFAKMRPLPEDNEASMRNAIKFVELTIPQPEEEKEEDVKE